MIGTLPTVVLDTPDARRLAAFYTALGGWTEQCANDDWITMETGDGWRIAAGSALDNAVIEAWHSTVEFELRRIEHFAAKAQARAKVAAWIEDYDRQRRHSALGMKPPVDYEQALAFGEAA